LGEVQSTIEPFNVPMNLSAIAIVGAACVYPDARTPGELWENALAQRRAFRRLPPERLRLEDFHSTDPESADTTYATEAAVIEGYEFDRVAFRVVGSTYRAADLAHWLALDVASRALADAGFAEGSGLPREATGVLLGNTLTGEFSRANALRLRWPYVRRVIEAALTREDWTAARRQTFLAKLEEEYKAPFAPVGEESLAGGLSNTIAGRICNQFNLKGGGYTVDGACASSLLAVANSCSALAAGDLEVAIAGGVDLSLDPFELVGFAKAGALAADEMRVFDRRSAGFWPGEGCGMVVLMRHEDALAQGRRVYAVIRGWGISSDGSGGILRPESDGQLEALRRAYRRAGFGFDTVAFCEGHGTGTAVGDATELEVLSRARREADLNSPPAAIGSIKANIGHTKAAAGVAGLIKAAMAVLTQVLPPTTGCEQPHGLLTGPTAQLRVLLGPEPWPQDRLLRASVSAMGFGGINAHVVLESAVAARRTSLSPRARLLARSTQDAELFLFAAETAGQLISQVESVAKLASRVSRAELADIAAQLAMTLPAGRVRAAIVASKPAELAERFETLAEWMRLGSPQRLGVSQGIFVGSRAAAPRIAFMFPGQGSPMHLDGGAWRRRFESVRELYACADLPAGDHTVSTRLMQPAIVTASLAGLKMLEKLGIRAEAAIGHSLGEFTALHWAGAFAEETLVRLVRVRGAAMEELGSPTGAMLALAASWQEAQDLLNNEPLAVVGYNSPRQTVLAGAAEAIRNFARRAVARGLQATELSVSHAFHTPFVAAAVPVLAEQLARETFSELTQSVFSTVTGTRLAAGQDLRDLLCRQITSPVRFLSAFDELRSGVDLLIEVGPGAALGGIVGDMSDLPVVSLDAGGNSLRGLLQAVGAAFVLGVPVKHMALFADRFTRPFDLDWKPRFFVNPCELAPITEPADAGERTAGSEKFEPGRIVARMDGERIEHGTGTPMAAIAVVRRLISQRTELPEAAIRDESRMLGDLHLNSITVGQLVSEAARQLGLPRMVGLTEFANASVAEFAVALEELKRVGGAARSDDPSLAPPGVDSWVRAFVVQLVETKRAGSRIDADSGGPGDWRIFGPLNLGLARKLRASFAKVAGAGVVVCLPVRPGPKNIAMLLEAGREALARQRPGRFVVVQHGWGGSGFARSLHLEDARVAVCVVNVPASHPRAIDWIVTEASSAEGFTEVHFTKEGRRYEPRLVSLPQTEGNVAGKNLEVGGRDAGSPLGREDVLLVTGGGKGIAAECALAFARETGVKLALIGRSDPKTEKELAANFSRFAAAGVQSGYVRADVTDAEAVRAAVAEIERNLGPVTGILHGAGVNTPQLIGSLDEASFQRTAQPKIGGVQNLLAAVDTKRLRLFVTFGSIIARVGMAGEADYATANEWLAALTREFQSRHPRCRCLALEWSVWSGAGMGERLGRIEALVRQGIAPITVDDGVRAFCGLLRQPASASTSASASLVIAGRFGESSTLKMIEPEMPLRRFLERKRVYYPGVELVVDAELSARADAYLADHVLHKQPLLPAMMGLEAMAQVAMTLSGATNVPVFENIEFSRPVAVPENAPTVVRLAALQRGRGLIEVCLRSEETDFQADHFRAVCRFDPREQNDFPRLALSPLESGSLALDPGNDLYGRILFHAGRFRRLGGYRLLKAKECVAEITPDDDAIWFGPYLPGEFVLGNPGARDAALHAIQACIPHRRILPTGIERLEILRQETGARVVRAKERLRNGNDFVWDVEITDERGELIERWRGLQLRAVEVMASSETWPDALLSTYVERRLEELGEAGGAVNVALERGWREERPPNSEAVIQQALGETARVWRRPDGKPVLLGGGDVSTAHAGGFTLAVAYGGGAACDLEEVEARTDAVWRDLVGEQKFRLAERIAHEQGESVDTAATRIWTALECLKKIGQPVKSPFVLESTTADGWTVLRSGWITIMTCVTAVRGAKALLGMAVAMRSAAEIRPAEAVPKTSAPG
jgi:enediyne polyketide synthase